MFGLFRPLRIGTLSGIAINVHSTFLLLLGFIGLTALSSGGGPAAIAELTMILTLFGVVILHEMGHALAARHFGIGTRDITLYPIGGMARLERMPERPIQELAISLAGPAVNAVLAGASYLLLTLPLGSLAGYFVQNVMWVNIALGIFNLLPAFPMDGGRVLRALLALKRDYVSATRIAAKVGRFMAVALGILGLSPWFSPMLIVIAVFVWTAGAAEERMVIARHSTRQSPFYMFTNTPREDHWRWQGGRRSRDASYVVVDD